MKYYVGIDIGTSGTKSVAFDNKGCICSSKSYEYDIIAPQPGYAEENPLDWKKGVLETLREISLELGGDSIVGIGLSGQMHGLVMLDSDNNILDNSIIWCDNRCEAEALLLDEFGREKIRAITGNYPMQAFTLSKLLWVKRNKPAIYKKIARIMLPKDYIRFILTGEFKTEPSDASGMQMMDIKNKTWSKELLSYFDIDERILPKIVESGDITGYVCDEVKSYTGLRNTFVVGGAGDQAACAIGNGVLGSQNASISLGSSGVIFKPLDDLSNMNPNMQYFCHAIKGIYHTMAVTNGCGNSLKWYKNLLCQKEILEAKNEDIYSYITKNISQVPAGTNGLIFLPYIMGERTPHLDPNATGLFIGLRGNTTKDEMTRAVIEGISYSLKDCFQYMDGINRIIISGGGAKNDIWCNIIASMLGTSIFKINVSEAPALGVAILAMVAGGEYSDVFEATGNIISITKAYEPSLDDKTIYDKYFKIYQKLYEKNKDIYRELKEN